MRYQFGDVVLVPFPPDDKPFFKELGRRPDMLEGVLVQHR